MGEFCEGSQVPRILILTLPRTAGGRRQGADLRAGGSGLPARPAKGTSSEGETEITYFPPPRDNPYFLLPVTVCRR